MNGELHVGCAMWAHKPWIGRFTTGHGNELADYASWCNAVEGNTTFYAAPSTATVSRWAEQAPIDFRFAFKVPRTVTHEQRLHISAHRDVAAFLRAIEPLGERIGPVQLQLPPSFGPESLDQLRAFITGLPTSHRWVVELRHPAFFDGGAVHRAADEALAAAGVGRVVLDTRPLYATDAVSPAALDERRSKPRLPIVTDVMGDEPVVRVIAGDDVGTAFAGLVRVDRAGGRVVGRPAVARTCSPINPRTVSRPHSPAASTPRVAERFPNLTPLPQPVAIDVSDNDDQASLF